MDIPDRSLFYDGKRQKASSNQFIKNINPATGELIQELEIASGSDITNVIESAQRGYKIWSKTSLTERGRVLRKAAEILRARNEEIAQIEMEDTGKPISEASTVDVISGADAIDYYGGVIAGMHGEFHDIGSSFAYTRIEPLGICAGIGAWNYPIQIASWKSAPALACGNSMIFKPSELTPRTALILAEVYREAGLPDGVFNVVQGASSVGKMLVEHPQIRKVSLTGEASTGKKVMEAAAKTLKHITLELGGKSPLIIFEDADLEEAVNGAMLANFYTQGEICSNGTRVYVAKEIKEEFIDRLVSKTEKLKIGDPVDRETQVGALISENHMKKVLYYIEEGKKTDSLITGGERWVSDNPKIKNGYYVVPTIFEAANDESKIMREEIFGPVLTIAEFTEEADVIRRANDTPYGLAAGVFTKDLQRAHRVIHSLEAGVCWINHFNITPVEVPFGPYKQSGFGNENGLATLRAYSQIKTVYVEMDKIDSPY